MEEDEEGAARCGTGRGKCLRERDRDAKKEGDTLLGGQRSRQRGTETRRVVGTENWRGETETQSV